MLPDTDPRHGTTRGYAAGCRERCCKEAINSYERKRRKRRAIYGEQGHYSVDATGTRRRIEAMMWMGWRASDIAAECGWSSGNAVLYAAQRQWVERGTASKIAKAFARLGMLPGPSREARKRAMRNGYLGPLAWDDIDDPNEQPTTGSNHRRRDDIDEAVVLRVLAGEQLPMTTAERREVVARLTARGWSEVRIEQHTGISKVTRYKGAA